jgi:hypothetical protein
MLNMPVIYIKFFYDSHKLLTIFILYDFVLGINNCLKCRFV